MELMTFHPAVDQTENQLERIDALKEKLHELPGGQERNAVSMELQNYRKKYKLRVLENDLQAAVQAVGENFLKIGALLVEIDNGYLYTVKWEYISITDYAEGVLGLKRSTTFNLMKVCREFCGGTAILNSKWEKYNYSQLVELLPLSDAEREKITPEMTQKQIREFKQKLLCPEEKTSVQLTGQNCENIAVENNILSGQTDCLTDRDFELIDSAIVKSKQELETISVLPTPVVIEPNYREILTDCWDSEIGLDLKNDEARDKWLENYASWGIWISIPELKLRYYRYRFPEQKVWFVVTEYFRTAGKIGTNSPGYEPLYSRIEPENEARWGYFYPKDDSISTLRDWLKEHRKELQK